MKLLLTASAHFVNAVANGLNLINRFKDNPKEADELDSIEVFWMKSFLILAVTLPKGFNLTNGFQDQWEHHSTFELEEKWDIREINQIKIPFWDPAQIVEAYGFNSRMRNRDFA